MAVTTLNVTLCIKVWTKKFKKTSGQWQLTKSRRAFITAGIINGNLNHTASVVINSNKCYTTKLLTVVNHCYLYLSTIITCQ